MDPRWGKCDKILIIVEPGKAAVNKLVNTESSIIVGVSVTHVFTPPPGSSPAPAQPGPLPCAPYFRTVPCNRNQVWAVYVVYIF